MNYYHVHARLLVVYCKLNISFQENQEDDKYSKLGLKATSPLDVYGIVFDYWSDLEPFKATLEFGNYFDINFKKTERLFYFCDHETAPRSYYEYYADLMSLSNATKCMKNCLSTRTTQGYLPLMKNLSMLKNCTPSEELCVEKDLTGYRLQFFNTKCPKPCNLTKFTGDLEYKDYGFEIDEQNLLLGIMYPSSDVMVFEEYPIYTLRSMLGSIGGSLGICVGFSIFDVLSRIVDKSFGV